MPQKNNAEDRAWRESGEQPRTGYPQVVRKMRKRVSIYLVPVESFDAYTLFTFLWAVCLALTGTFWTGYFTGWQHVGVYFAAWCFSGFTAIFLGLSIWKFISARCKTQEVPFEDVMGSRGE